MNDLKELEEQLNWLVKHLRYTQALCEIIIENLPDTDKEHLIKLVKKRISEI